jgi:hypothetical protein
MQGIEGLEKNKNGRGKLNLLFLLELGYPFFFPEISELQGLRIPELVQVAPMVPSPSDFD